MTAPLTTSAAMRSMIEAWEGCVLHAYRDSVAVLTIGYGHTGRDVHDGEQITQAEADTLLQDDLRQTEAAVTRLVSVPGAFKATQQQFDALVSFAYNLGAGALASSTLLKRHLVGDFVGAAAQFPLWCHAGGVELAGLLHRREGEAAVYLNGTYT